MATLSGEKLSRMIEVVRVKLDALDDRDAISTLEDTLSVDFEEHFEFQQLQARYHAMELLSPEAAQIVYVALGEVGSDSNGGWASKTDLPTKVVVTQLMAELLQRAIDEKRGYSRKV